MRTKTLKFTADVTGTPFNFVVPAGVYRFRARLLGGGGGGGGGGRANTTGGEPGGGGGGARFTEVWVDCNPGDTWVCVLGAGGTGGTGQAAGGAPGSVSGGKGGDTTLTGGGAVYTGWGAQGGSLGFAAATNKASIGGQPVRARALGADGYGAPNGADALGIGVNIPGQGGTHITVSNLTSYSMYLDGVNSSASKGGDGGTGNDFATTCGKGGGGGGASEWPYDSWDGLPAGRTGGQGGNYKTTNGTGNNGTAGRYGGGGGGGGGGRNSAGTNAGGAGGAGGMGCIEIVLQR